MLSQSVTFPPSLEFVGKARSPPLEWSPVGDCARLVQAMAANIRLRLSGPGDPSYPAAKFPKATPPLLVHSLEVKQVPFRLELKTMDTFKKLGT